MGRLVAVSAIVLAVVLGFMAACSDGTGPQSVGAGNSLGGAGNSVGLIVSAPVRSLSGATITAPVVNVASASVVYVSLPPGSVPAGLNATITNEATGQSVTTDIVAGGFDPVPLAASVGDTVAVDITGTPSFTPVRVRLNIAPDRPPQPVRTSPPSGGRDVPLNSIIIVVFSEPIDSATLTTQSVQLLRDATPVTGAVTFADSSHLMVEFHPTSQLASETAYRLHVSTAMRDVNGVALISPLDVPFTTGGTQGTSDVFVVGERGTILHYNGTSWSPQTSGTASILFGVWGSSGSDVFAVGDHGTVLHYDGTRWALQPTPDSSRLIGVWGSSDRDVFAVGDLGTILHFDGTFWTRQRRDTTTFLESVWGSSGSNVFAVGYDGTILHYDGTGWITQRTDSAITLFGVWGTSGTDVFAVGDSILHYDGTSWKPQRISTVFGVWGGSGNDVFAVGDYGSILHYNGTSWTLQDCNYCYFTSGWPSELDGVWGISSSDVFAVGMGGGIVHYDGIHWAVQASGTTAYLWGIWGSSGTK